MIPQLMTTTPAEGLSTRYGFISTHQTLQPFLDEGYTVTGAMTVKVRKRRAEMAPYAKHLLRLRPAQAPTTVGDVIPEVVLINSHDGTSRFTLLAGLFRLICSNGLIISDVSLGGYSFSHTKLQASKALDGARQLAVSAQDAATRLIPSMQARTMSLDESLEWASSLGTAYRPDDLLMIRRPEDAPNNLWTVYNRVQENLTKGGNRLLAPAGRGRRSSGIRNIDRTVTMNTNLWASAVAYLERS